MPQSAALLRPLIRRNRRQWKDNTKKKAVFADLNKRLHAAEQGGQVGFILSFDTLHKQITLYRAPKEHRVLSDKAIFRTLNLSIGQRGTRVNGCIRHHRGAPDVFTRGFFVPAICFNPNLPANIWVALKNIKAESDSEIVVPFPPAPLLN